MLRSVVEAVAILVDQYSGVILTIGTLVAVAGMLATIPIVFGNIDIGGGSGTPTFSRAAEPMATSIPG
jgi:hypothetical protein